jgi:hypothetical protein
MIFANIAFWFLVAVIVLKVFVMAGEASKKKNSGKNLPPDA